MEASNPSAVRLSLAESGRLSGVLWRSKRRGTRAVASSCPGLPWQTRSSKPSPVEPAGGDAAALRPTEGVSAHWRVVTGFDLKRPRAVHHIGEPAGGVLEGDPGSGVAEAQTVRLYDRREHFIRVDLVVLTLKQSEAVSGGGDLRRAHGRALLGWLDRRHAALRHELDCITSWRGSRGDEAHLNHPASAGARSARTA